MSVKHFIDTNILIYAFSEDEPRAGVAETLLATGGSMSVQVLNEFIHVSRRKLNLEWPEIEERLVVIKALATELVPISITLHERAVELARDHNFSFYDALIIAAALSTGCTHLMTEDMQHGRVIGDLIINNPFLMPYTQLSRRV
jgi:predicted nucleic acid-binding protein